MEYRVNRRRLLWSVVLLLPVSVGAFVWQSERLRTSIELFSQVVQLVETTALDSLPQDEIYRRAARGLISEMNDPYAAILSPEELSAFERNSLGNRYAGTGITIRSLGGYITAIRVNPTGPAHEMGLRAGDRIVAVDGASMAGVATDSVSRLLLGVPGTRVLVTYERAGQSAPIDIGIERAVVRVAAVPYATLLDDGVGYVPIQRFNDVAAADVADAILRLERQGAKGFVLDLRGNGGGDLFQALRMAGLFLPEGVEVSRVQHRGKPPEVYRTEQAPLLADAPVVVLVDGRSASASEIVAGSLQDHDRALVVGTRSFGKGLVQTQSRLRSGWAVRLTTGKWYTPSGRSIQSEHEGLDDGRFVSTDTLVNRPMFRSTSGRPIVGGGGVTPDLVVRPDTVSRAEREFARALGTRVAEMQDAVLEVAREVAGPAGGNPMPVPSSWRSLLRARLVQAEIMVPDSIWNEAQPVIDRLLAGQVSGLAVGDSAAFLLQAPADAQLRVARELILKAGSQARLFELASYPG